MRQVPEEYLAGGLPDFISGEYFSLSNALVIHLDELDTKRKKRMDAKTYKKKLKEYFNNECAYCGVVSDKPTIDHVIPKSKSGSDDRSNWIPACRICNLRKGDSIAFSWFQAQKFYDVFKWKRIVSVLTGETNIFKDSTAQFNDLLDQYTPSQSSD